MAGDEVESDNSNDLPLDDSVYISEEEDTMEKMKRGLKKFGKDLKKGAEDLADSSKKFATKSKEKYDTAREERKKAKAMKDPLNFPWSNLSVVELKDNLKSLGLKVSGKKDDLIERILEHYRTEIPEMEDGTPHLMEDLEPMDENPPAPDIDELIEEQEEVVEELSPSFEEVDPETPVVQFEGSEQLYVHDAPKNIKIKKDYSFKVINYVNFIFGLSMFFITLCILNKGFDFGWDVGFIYDFIANRFVRSYGGMSEVQVTSLAGALSLMLCLSSLMYFSGRPKVAASLAVATIVVSISTRAIVAFFTTASDNYDGLFYLMVDSIVATPFCFSVWIPALFKSSLSDNSFYHSDTFTSPMEPISDMLSMESFTANGLSGFIEGDEMNDFQVTKPKRPSRRGRVVFFYEGFFLIWATILWPAIFYSLVALASLDFRSSQGLPADFNSGSITGQAFLALLFFMATVCTYAVYKYDREAREGPIYAKSKAAYHEQMDQYLGLKNAYYELQAKKLEVQAESISGYNKDN
ncbi:SAP domain-containing protein [Euryarchaeota archaeon]|nr:SAP domain-containing protein [Euryarchaeota archaeon]